MEEKLKSGDKVEALLEALACYAEDVLDDLDDVSTNEINETISPRGDKQTAAPPYQIHIHQCPDCAADHCHLGKLGANTRG